MKDDGWSWLDHNGKQLEEHPENITIKYAFLVKFSCLQTVLCDLYGSSMALTNKYYKNNSQINNAIIIRYNDYVYKVS